MMAFLVDDLLDFAQLNAGKFRKVIKKFELKDSIDEVIDIQKEKAHMGGIKLTAMFKPQLDENKIISLFNKLPSGKIAKKEK